MTCQECEIRLGLGEDAGEHLESCAECRWLAHELRLNSCALGEMRVRPGMQWVFAAAAAVLILVFLRAPQADTFPLPPMRAAVAEKPSTAGRGPAPHRKVKRHAEEPLRVKLFTSDPDVVIYWMVDKKEGYE
jgi:hypothetical protein